MASAINLVTRGLFGSGGALARASGGLFAFAGDYEPPDPPDPDDPISTPGLTGATITPNRATGVISTVRSRSSGGLLS